jgi:UDP-hydrolysing UDP-N-acetyl-D-glucosamine 2-epimerase
MRRKLMAGNEGVSRRRKISVLLVDRANYGRMRPVMKAIAEHPSLELQTICTGTMVLERFGLAEREVVSDGFRIDGRVYIELEGSVPTTMAKSLGFATIELATEFRRLQPEIVLLIGDRYEALAAAQAAAYQNICLAHIQGGEVSGSVDECARHAISRFAHFHFPATERAAGYLRRMGEDPDTVFMVGCPVGDYIKSLDPALPADVFSGRGVGAPLVPEEPYFLVIYHPVTTEFGSEEAQAETLLGVLHELQHPTAWLWPNIDAGADHISKVLRRYRERYPSNRWLHLIKNLPPELFQKVLKNARCAIGNSSSFVRDSSFSGTPVVLVGDRQVGREIAENVLPVKCQSSKLKEGIVSQQERGRYEPSSLYGDGSASPRIAEMLAKVEPYRQKRLHYIWDECPER